jgi:hypothetical protein
LSSPETNSLPQDEPKCEKKLFWRGKVSQAFWPDPPGGKSGATHVRRENLTFIAAVRRESLTYEGIPRSPPAELFQR